MALIFRERQLSYEVRKMYDFNNEILERPILNTREEKFAI